MAKIEWYQDTRVVTVIGIGFRGCDAVGAMIQNGIKNICYVVASSDPIMLERSLTATKILVPEGFAHAPHEENEVTEKNHQDEIEAAISGSYLLLVIGAACEDLTPYLGSVIAYSARKLGIFSIGITTMPFLFEGREKFIAAEDSIKIMSEYFNPLVVVPSEKISPISGSREIKDSIKAVNGVLSDLVFTLMGRELMAGDVEDTVRIVKNGGICFVGSGTDSSKKSGRPKAAALNAVSKIESNGISLSEAAGVMICTAGTPSLKIHEVREATLAVMNLTHEDADIAFSAYCNRKDESEIRVTILATGRKGN